MTGAGGGCLGYGASEECTPAGQELSGWALEVDLLADSWDPTDVPHVAFSLNGAHDNPMFWAEISGVENNGVHDLKLHVDSAQVVVELDSQVLISENIEHTGFGAEVGFSATSGPGGSQVVVDRIAVTQPSCGQ